MKTQSMYILNNLIEINHKNILVFIKIKYLKIYEIILFTYDC